MTSPFDTIGRRYAHTQGSPLFWLVLPIPLLELALPFFVPLPESVILFLIAIAVFVAGLGWYCSTLHVEDQGEELAAWFGVYPLIGVRIPYRDILSFEADRSTWIDGWGLHYTRGGWLYNVWGFDCVRITTARRSVRIGTDDVDGLLALLRERVGHLP